MQKILVSVDNSDIKELVIAQAKDFAAHYPEAEITLVTIVPPYMPSHGEQVSFTGDIVAIMFEQADAMLDEAKSLFGEYAEQVTTMSIGSPDIADSIIELSARHDLVIMGTRGLSGLREYVGSVSHKVIHKAGCPVLLVR